MSKKSKRKTRAKKSKKNMTKGIVSFLYRHKIALFIILCVFISFIFIRKNEILYSIKDTISTSDKTQAPKESIYLDEENLYLANLKEKYSGYGRQVSLVHTKKIIEDACSYIKNIEGHSFWYSENAQDLLLVTAVVESDLRARYSQYGGNAVGIFQIEYITFKDFWFRAIPKSYPKLYKAMQRDFGNIDFEMLQNNDLLSAIFARLVYARAKTKIPYRNDVHEQAAYYKKYYNTHLGKAKTDTFIKKKSNMHKLK